MREPLPLTVREARNHLADGAGIRARIALVHGAPPVTVRIDPLIVLHAMAEDDPDAKTTFVEDPDGNLVHTP